MITHNNNDNFDDFEVYVRLTLTKFTQVWEQVTRIWDQIRVSTMKKGSKNHFHEPLKDLNIDHEYWIWVDGTLLLEHTIKKGQKLVNNKKSLEWKILNKWLNFLPPTYKVKWNDIGGKIKLKKTLVSSKLVWAFKDV
jgi:hypothetical protein